MKRDTCAALTRSHAYHILTYASTNCPTWFTARVGISPFSSLKLNERKAHLTTLLSYDDLHDSFCSPPTSTLSQTSQRTHRRLWSGGWIEMNSFLTALSTTLTKTAWLCLKYEFMYKRTLRVKYGQYMNIPYSRALFNDVMGGDTCWYVLRSDARHATDVLEATYCDEITPPAFCEEGSAEVEREAQTLR